jgi:transketolase
MHSPLAREVAASLSLKLGRPNLEEFADTVQGLARADPRLLVVTSDSRGSGKLAPFAAALPRQLVDVGIAEQNLVGVAAGLASTGRTVFAVSPACFLTARSFEQIKNDLCYSDNAVVLVGISAGVSYGALGTTHHSLHDFAALRAVNNITIVAPADNYETREAVTAAAAARHPVYLRFGKAALYHLPESPAFALGAARQLRPGSDGAFLATGETVIHALLASAYLDQNYGLKIRVVSLPTVKPLDAGAVLRAARECGAVVTVEEHMVNGGLGEACAGLLAQAGVGRPFKIAGIPDEYTVTGSQADIFGHYGLAMEGLAQTMRALLHG